MKVYIKFLTFIFVKSLLYVIFSSYTNSSPLTTRPNALFVVIRDAAQHIPVSTVILPKRILIPLSRLELTGLLLALPLITRDFKTQA